MKEKDPERQKKAIPNDESPDGPPGDARSLMYELKVHQEELKAQNEDLRQAQLDLSRARDRYKELFDSAPIGYMILDGRRTIREANLTAASLLGIPREDLIGTHLSKYMERREADTYYLLLTEVRDKGTQRSRELAFRRPDGTLFHGHLETSPYEDSLNGNGWRIALVDITARKQAEKALQEANEFLEKKVRERTMELRKLASELVMAEERERKRIAGVLHDDIAQILAAIRMRLDSLQDVPSDSRDRETLTDAKSLLVQTIQETRGLMNDLGNPLLFDMGLKAACESLADRLMNKHPIRISCNIQDAYKHLSTDVKIILYQVIRELLANVVKHSRAKNVRVTIEMENGHFRLKVEDDGVGFDPKKLGTPTVEGGFGLYSIRERLIAIDGSLRIESVPETGTAVTAILPAALG